MEYRKIKGIRHYVFENMDEFREYFTSRGEPVPELVPWRTARQGDWVQADDGGIVQILKWGPIKHPGDSKNYHAHNGYVRTIVGTFLQNNKTFMDTSFQLHSNRYSFAPVTSFYDHKKRRLTRKNPTKRERLFVLDVLRGKDLRSAYIDNFGGNGLNWKEKVVLLLKTERITRMLKEEIEKIANENGITASWVLKGLKELYEESNVDSVKLSALRELADIIGLKERDTSIMRQKSAALFAPIDPNLVDQIEKERNENLLLPVGTLQDE